MLNTLSLDVSSTVYWSYMKKYLLVKERGEHAFMSSINRALMLGFKFMEPPKTIVLHNNIEFIAHLIKEDYEIPCSDV